MLYIPFLFGALAAGGRLLPLLLLGVAVTLLFIGRESYLAWRRARVHGRDAGNATRLMALYFGLAVAFSGPLALLYRLWGLIPLGVVAGALLLWNGQQAARREERSVLTQLIGIGGLMLAGPAAYYASTGRWDEREVWIWTLSTAYFAGSVFYVKMRVQTAHAKSPQALGRARLQSAVYHVALAVILATLVSAGRCSPLLLIAFAPIILRALWPVVRAPRELVLRQVGYLEVAYSLVFLIFGVLGVRATV